MIKKKKYKFAIFVDEHGRERLHLKKLIELLDDKYPYLKQAGRCGRERIISKAQVKDVIVFGSSKRNDFATVTSGDYDDLTEDCRFTLVNLQGDFKKVKKLLHRYAESNYPEQFEVEEKPYCYKASSVVIIDDTTSPNWWDDIVVLDVPRRKRRAAAIVQQPVTKKKRKPAKYLEEVKVHHNHVKVGFDTFDILENIHGQEYVRVDGTKYWVDRDSFGNGKLSTV